MTTKESAQILAVLTAAYPNAYKNISDQEAAAVALVWASQFAEIPYDIVFMALQKAISTCKFPPTICEVKGKLSDLSWEAYEAIENIHRREKYRNGEADSQQLKEYVRIYELTSKFKNRIAEPTLGSMLPYSQRALAAGMIEGK